MSDTLLQTDVAQHWQLNAEKSEGPLGLVSSENMARLCGDYVTLYDRHEKLREEHAEMREQMTGLEDRVQEMMTTLVDAFEEATASQRATMERFAKERLTP